MGLGRRTPILVRSVKAKLTESDSAYITQSTSAASHPSRYPENRGSSTANATPVQRPMSENVPALGSIVWVTAARSKDKSLAESPGSGCWALISPVDRMSPNRPESPAPAAEIVMSATGSIWKCWSSGTGGAAGGGPEGSGAGTGGGGSAARASAERASSAMKAVATARHEWSILGAQRKTETILMPVRYSQL